MSAVEPKKVAVIGQGYVGLPLAMQCCKAGHMVVGIDLDKSKIDFLNESKSYVEDVSDAELKSHNENGRYLAVSSYDPARNFDIAVVTVPTPLNGAQPDLSYIQRAAVALAPLISSGSTVILESTSYPGTTENFFLPLLESGSNLVAGEDFHLGYSPERIDPGNSEWTLENTPKIVSGINARSLDSVTKFYDSLGIKVVPVQTTKEAELAKLLENTFRHVNVALVNELAVFANALDVNIWAAIDAASTKPFGFMRFTPGPGVGGHCLPVDPSYLSWAIRERTGQSFRFVELANSVNEGMAAYVVERARGLLGSDLLLGSNILLVGLGYKSNSGDVREAPSLRIAELLRAEGANVFGFDPLVKPDLWPDSISALSKSLASSMNLAILVTHHEGVADDLIQTLACPVLDTRNALSGSPRTVRL